MKPASFDYVRPATLDRAIAALADHNGNARVLAGGQTLGPMLNMRIATPKCLVDLGRIDALKRIDDRADRIVIGAGVTHAAIEDTSDLSATWQLLSYAASTIAYRAIRNRGTIGGSLAHADPAADWITVMMALDARLTIAGQKGRRVVEMRDFMRGAFTTAIGPQEILESIELTKLSPSVRWGYYKISRKLGEFPDAICVAVFDRERGVNRIAVGGLNGAPVLQQPFAEHVAREGVGATTGQTAREALTAVAPGLDAVDLQLHGAAMRRALVQALS